MRRFINVLTFFACQKQLYKKIVHETDPEAKCLDGTPPGLYVSEGTEKSKMVIFLEGGGYCDGSSLDAVIESCYKRSKTLLGSSTPWPENFEGQGYLSDSPSNIFANWTKIILFYCDGSLHQGYRPEPISYKGTHLYFRGESILRAQIKFLSLNYGFNELEKLVWTGGSAGAIGAYIWNNQILSIVSEKTEVFTIMDSGVFIDGVSFKTGKNEFRESLKNLLKVSNPEQPPPNPSCATALAKSQHWKCFFLQYSWFWVRGQKLYIGSQYDSWAIPNILHISCLKQGTSGSQTLASCSEKEIKHIEEYRKNYIETIIPLLEDKNNNYWAIACSNHVYACLDFFYDSSLEKVPKNFGLTVKGAIQKFIQKNKVNSVDPVAWPSNIPCSH